SDLSLHTGQRPMVLWAIRITFLGLLCVCQTGTLNLSISWLNLTGKIPGCQRIPFTFSQDRNHLSRKGPPWQRRRRCRDRAPAETEPTRGDVAGRTLQGGDVAGGDVAEMEPSPRQARRGKTSKGCLQSLRCW